MRRLALSAFLALALTGPAPAAPKVVATFGPVHGIVAAIMEGIAEPTLLIDQPVSPHHYALTPSKRRVLEDADLIFGIGPTLEAGVWEAIEEISTGQVALMDFIESHLMLTAEEMAHDHDGDGVPDHAPEDHEEHADGHEDDADHEVDADHEHEDHAHEGANPHVWLDTEIAGDLAEFVARILGDQDPENAVAYLANAQSFRVTLNRVDADIEAGLAGHRDAVAVSYHDAFPWFTRQWEIEYGYVVIEPDLTPSAARVAEIRAQAAAGEIACLMTEPQFQPDLLEALAADFGLPVVEIDPVGTAIPPGPGFYPELMRQVGVAFATCFGR